MKRSSVSDATGRWPRQYLRRVDRDGAVDRNDAAEGEVSADSNEGSSQPPLDAFPELEWNWQFALGRSWCVFSAPPFLWRNRYR